MSGAGEGRGSGPESCCFTELGGFFLCHFCVSHRSSEPRQGMWAEFPMGAKKAMFVFCFVTHDLAASKEPWHLYPALMAPAKQRAFLEEWCGSS